MRVKVKFDNYDELACANCGEGSSWKITLRGIVIYLCSDCGEDLKRYL